MNIKAEILKLAKSKIDADAVGKYAEYYTDDIYKLFSLQKQEIVEEIEKEVLQTVGAILTPLAKKAISDVILGFNNQSTKN